MDVGIRITREVFLLMYFFFINIRVNLEGTVTLISNILSSFDSCLNGLLQILDAQQIIIRFLCMDKVKRTEIVVRFYQQTD